MTSMGDIISQATSRSELSALLASDKFGIYPAKAYLALDGVTDDYAALYALINTTINGEDAEIWFPDGVCLIGTNITIPSNVKLVFLNGGMLKPESGVTITGSDAKIEAGLYQVFDLSDSGVVAGDWDVANFEAHWLGANADGSTDDYSVIAALLTLMSGKTIDLRGYDYALDTTIVIPTYTIVKNATFTLATTANVTLVRYAEVHNIKVQGRSDAYADIGFLIYDRFVRLYNVSAKYCEKGYSINSSILDALIWGVIFDNFTTYYCNTAVYIYSDSTDSAMTGIVFNNAILQAYEYGIRFHKNTAATQLSHFSFSNITIEMIGGKSYTNVYALYLDSFWSNYSNINVFNDFGPNCYGLYIVRTTVAPSIIGGYQNNSFSNMTIEGLINSNDMFYLNKISNITWLSKTFGSGVRSRDRIADYPRKIYTNKDISALHANTTATVALSNYEIDYTNSSGGLVNVAIWLELPKALTNLFIKSNYIQSRILFEIYDGTGIIETNVTATSYITSDNTATVIENGTAVDVASDEQGQLKAFSYNMGDSENLGSLTRDAVSHIRFVIPVADTLSLTVKNIELYNHLCLVNGMDDQEDYLLL